MIKVEEKNLINIIFEEKNNKDNLDESLGTIIASSGLPIGFLLINLLSIIWIKQTKLEDEEYLSGKMTDILGKKTIVKVLKDDKMINAFTTPFLKENGYQLIIISTGLLNLLENEREVIAILLHEAGHIHFKHGQKTYPIDISLKTFLLYLAGALSFGTLGFAGTYAVIPLALFLMYIYNTLIPPIWLQPHEYQADNYAIKYGYGKDLKMAFERFRIKFGSQHKFTRSKISDILQKISLYKSSHPDFEERVNNILLNKDIYEAIGKNNISNVKSIVKKELQ